MKQPRTKRELIDYISDILQKRIEKRGARIYVLCGEKKIEFGEPREIGVKKRYGRKKDKQEKR